MVTAAKAVCGGDLPSFLFTETGCDHLLARVVLLDRRDSTFSKGLMATATDHRVDALGAHATTPQTALLHFVYFLFFSFDLE